MADGLGWPGDRHREKGGPASGASHSRGSRSGRAPIQFWPRAGHRL